MKKDKGGKRSANIIMSYGVLKCFYNSNMVVEAFAKLYSKIVQNHIVLKWWNNAIAVMLKKRKGPRIDKLIIIQLIQSDVQMLMREVILPSANEVIHMDQLNTFQYARKYTTTMNVLVEKQLMFESSVLSREESV